MSPTGSCMNTWSLVSDINWEGYFMGNRFREGIVSSHFGLVTNMNFACKWMEIENSFLSEETQTQKEEYGMYSLISLSLIHISEPTRQY